MIKKLLLQIINPEMNVGVEQLLSTDCKGRLIAYEKLLPPGKEIRQHWRIKVGDKFDKAKYYPEIFEQMIINDNAFAFYPSVKQTVELQGQKLKVQNRLIVEVDPHTSSIEYAGKVFDTLSKAIKRLGIPMRRFHSGSSSGRCHIEIDAENVLNGTSYLLSEYPFIGSAAKESIELGNVQSNYKTVLTALKHAIFLTTLNYLHDEHPPRITMDRFNPDHGYALVDFPSTVSIGTGSMKKIVRLDEKTREILRKVNQDNSNFSNWGDLPFTINLCTPLRDGEQAPKSNTEILSLCNALFAADRCNLYFPMLIKQAEEKVTTDTIETVLKRTRVDQFNDFHKLSEEKFRERYLKKVEPLI
jgi:hypothetical protein